MDPRVILIGGPPGAGKTTLARALATRLGCAAVSGDDLVIAGRVLTTADTHPAFHAMGTIGHVRYFTETEPEQLIADATALQAAMWPAFAAVIRRHVADDDPVVIDWWLLDPVRVAALESSAVGSLWLHIDPGFLDLRERSVEGFRDGSADPDRMHANFMARSSWRNLVVAESARRLGLPVLHQPGDRSVEDLVDAAIAVLEPQ